MMRNGQNNNKRMRGRSRGKSQNPLTRVYESNGPDVKIRGTAHHVAEKYLQLARDAQSSGDPVGAENYYQHAEHYFRMIAAAQEQFRQQNPYMRPEDQQRDGGYDESDDDGSDQGEPGYSPREPHQMREHQPYQRDPQQRDNQQRDHQQREHQQREHQQRDYQPREHQPRDHQPREHQPREHRFQPREQPQPYADRAPPSQPEPRDEGDVDRLPAFVTGGAPAPPNGAPPGPTNGAEGNAAERFPLHRRRRRRGPREGQEGERPVRPAGE